ncbi:MAG: hypothetical protein V2A34_08655, partial [Lentisphaerota bacterium]
AWFKVTYTLISAGDNLDCTANPLDHDYTDPEPPPPVLVTTASTMTYASVCSQLGQITGSNQGYPDVPDPDIDLQPNCTTITNGQEVLFTMNIRNDAQRGNAENLHLRVRFGSAWTNLSLIASNIVQSGTGVMEYEQQGDTNVLIDLPGVIMDPLDDYVFMIFRATARQAPGSLTVLGEVAGDCDDSRIIAQCIFTNTLGEAPLANTMTGAVIQAVNGQYYGFDQDLSSVIGNTFSKTVRGANESVLLAAKERTARIGEALFYRLEASFFGNVFSNIYVVESLPDQMAFGSPVNYAFSGGITNAEYDPLTGVFTIQPQIVNAQTPSSFIVDIPVVVSNRADNRTGTVITNTADCLFEVVGFTNPLPSSSSTVALLEPSLSITKSGSTNDVAAGQYMFFTNVVVHTGASVTSAYDLVFSDLLPEGFTFSGINLAADGADNNGNGFVDEAVEGELIQSDRLILISYTNNPHLTNVAIGVTNTFVFQALTKDQIVGSLLINTSRVTWTSLPGPDTGGNERTGDGGLNDYYDTNTYAVRSVALLGAGKTLLSTSQTNTSEGATNAFTIGEREVYGIRVDVPQGVIQGLSIKDVMPMGMDWVGTNNSAGLSYPGLGYYFTVPEGGLRVPTNTAEGLVITDVGGSGGDVTFTFPPFTNAADGEITNDFFILQLECAILNDPTNRGILPNIYSNRNSAEITDAFNTLTATGPVYHIVEPDLRVGKYLTPTNPDAGDTVTISLVVSNRTEGLGEAYHVNVSDILSSNVYDTATLTVLATPAGWAVSNTADAAGLTHYFYSLDNTQLPPGQAVTNIFSIALSQRVSPNRVYTNVVFAECDGLHNDPPVGINRRVDLATNRAAFQIPNMIVAKGLYATSETNNPPDSTNGFAQVGEILTYALTVTLPDGTITNLSVVDTLPLGLSYVFGSARVDTNGFSGTLGTLNVQPTGTLMSAGGTIFTNLFIGNTVVTAGEGISNNTFVLYFDAVVRNTNINIGVPTVSVLSNKASITYSGNPAPPSTSDIIRVSVLEPRLAITKAIPQTLVDAGDTIDVNLYVTNTGSAAAYNVLISDLLDPSYFDIGSVANISLPTGFVSEVQGSTFRILSDTNAPAGTNAVKAGESLAFSFQVNMSQNLRPNVNITNRAVLSAISLYATNLYASQRSYTLTNSDTLKARNFGISKALFATSETNLPPDSTTTNLQIGEIITYRIAVSPPEGTVTNLLLTDRTGSNGLAYVRNSARTDTNGFHGVLGEFTETAGAGLLMPMGVNMTFTFTNIVVTADGDTNNDTFFLLADYVALNTNRNNGLSPTNTIHTNTAWVTYNGNPDAPVTSGVVRTMVVEPRIALFKNASPTNIDAGDTVTITLTITNSGYAAAYDMQIADPLNPSYFDFSTVTTGTVPTGFVMVATNNAVYVRSDTASPAGTNALEAGEGLVFTFQVHMAQSLTPNAILTNTASAMMSSLYATNLYGAQRYYSATGSVLFKANDFGLVKRLYSTSETNNPPDSTNGLAQIGERVTYELEVQLPESTITNLTFTDFVPSGMAFVVNSLLVSTNHFNGTLAPGTNVTPNTGLLGGNGEDVTIQFTGNTIVSNDNEPTNDVLMLYLDFVTLNAAGNSGLPPASRLTNNASVTFAGNPAAPAVSSNVVITLIEPLLSMSKSVSTNRADAGDPVTFTIAATNTGTGAAYGLLINDYLNPVFFNTGTIANVVLPTGYVYEVVNDFFQIRSDTNAPAGTNALQAGQSLAFAFQIDMAQSLPPNALITNRAMLSARTLMETNLYGNQREYGVTNTAIFRADNFILGKSLYATSETGPVDSTNAFAQIGEIFTFELTAQLPEGTISNLTFRDFIPNGMGYIIDSLVVDTNSLRGVLAPVTNVTPSAGPIGPGGADLTVAFNGHTIVENDNDLTNNVLRLRYNTIALDTNVLSGLPPARSVITNRADITCSGNPSNPALSGIVVLTFIEPQLVLRKTMSLTHGDAGDWVDVTLTMTNTGTGAAYDLAVTDLVRGVYFDITTITNTTLPVGFLFAVTTNGTDATVHYTSDPASAPPTNTIEAGEGLTFVFRSQISQGVEPGMVLTNAARIATADTIYHTNVYAISRDESGSFDGASLAITNMHMAKSFLGSTATEPWETSGTDVTIGEEAIYRLTVTLPESTITNLTLADQVPVGLEYVPGSIQIITTNFSGQLPGAPSVSGGGSGTDLTITFNGNTIVSNDNDTANNSLAIEFHLLTLDILSNHGLPVGIDGLGPSILPDQATVAFGGHAPQSTSTVVNVRVVEPRLYLQKTMTGPSNDWMTLSLVATNVGLSTAFDVELQDQFPSNWWNIASVTGTPPAGFIYNISNDSARAYLTILNDTNTLAPTNCILVGQTVAFPFMAQIQPHARGTVTNTGSVHIYSTLPGPQPGKRDEPSTNTTARAPLPGYDVVKVIQSPLGRAAAPGETVVFHIVVTNDGLIGLNPVAVDDTYDPVHLGFLSAVPTPTTSGGGALAWTNVGVVTAGGSTTLVVNFTALASTAGDQTTNDVEIAVFTTNGLPLPGQEDQAFIEVASVGYNLLKTLSSPANRAAEVGETITFTILVSNTGEVDLVTVPVTDSFTSTLLGYQSAIPAADSNVAGSVYWTNVGPVVAGASTTLVVNFTALASSASQLR